MREGQHSRLRRSLVRRCVPTCPSRQAAQAAWLVRPGCPLARHGARHGARQGDPAWGRGTGDGKATESCGASGARGRLALQPRRRSQPEGRCSAELGSRWGRMGSCHDIRWCLRHFWACEELGGVSACVWCQNCSWLLLPLSPQRAPRSAGRCPSVPAQGGRRGREASTARSGSRPRSQPRVSRAHVPTNAPHTPRTRTRTHTCMCAHRRGAWRSPCRPPRASGDTTSPAHSQPRAPRPVQGAGGLIPTPPARRHAPDPPWSGCPSE